MLETLSYQATLRRGYALVKGPDGALIRNGEIAKNTPEMTVIFAQGEVQVTPLNGGEPSKPKPVAAKKKTVTPKSGGQGSLF